MRRAPSVPRALVAFAVLFICFVADSRAQVPLNPPVSPFDKTARISSPYGPRIHPKTKEKQFHAGVDYPGALGDPIEAVEGGTIVNIEQDGLDDWYVSVKGATALFSYIHIFNNDLYNNVISPTPVFGNYAQAFLNAGTALVPVDLRLISPSTPPSLLDACFAIVFWGGVDGRNSPPSKALTTPGCAGVSVAGTVAKDAVADREVIAPVGNSGRSTGPHVHLNADYGNKSPLVFVDHLPSIYTAAAHTSPKGGSLYLDVNFTSGWDLDGAAFLLLGSPDAGGYGVLIYTYGGSPFAPTCASFEVPQFSCLVVKGCPYGCENSFFSDGESLGVLPSAQPGNVSFVMPPGLGPPPAFYCGPNSPGKTLCGFPGEENPSYAAIVSPYNVCDVASLSPPTVATPPPPAGDSVPLVTIGGGGFNVYVLVGPASVPGVPPTPACPFGPG
jgi:hypothetical protein